MSENSTRIKRDKYIKFWVFYVPTSSVHGGKSSGRDAAKKAKANVTFSLVFSSRESGAGCVWIFLIGSFDDQKHDRKIHS